MRAVYGGLPDHGRSVFIAFHAMLLGFGVWCYLRWVRRGGEAAHRALALVALKPSQSVGAGK